MGTNSTGCTEWERDYDPMTEKKKIRLKRIEAHSDEELTEAVRLAIEHCARHGIDFWKIMHGVDAYMQRRKRQDARRAASEWSDEPLDPWGNS